MGNDVNYIQVWQEPGVTLQYTIVVARGVDRGGSVRISTDVNVGRLFPEI